MKTLKGALDPATDNVAKRLQKAGYQTALVGKWHLKKPPAGFDYWNIIKGQGRSFRANLAGKTPPDWRDAMYYRYYGGQPERPAHFGIRTHDAKLIYYDGLESMPEENRWEFYDLRRDPEETRNAFHDAENAEAVDRLKRRLAKLQADLGDAP